MPTKKRAADPVASEELDGDVGYVKRNKTTGRPTRQSAGRRLLPADFVNPNDVIEDPSDSEYEDDKELSGKRHKWTTRRRRISPPRELPPAEPLDDISLKRDINTPSTASAKSQELALTFHVPPGHVGPFVVRLDLGTILAGSPRTPKVFPTQSASVVKCAASRSSSISSDSASLSQVNFLSLPPELRNFIYRLVLVKGTAINLFNADKFERSAAMLATCRQIHNEGTQILYGENPIELVRQWRKRAAYFSSEWKEVAYKDCFRFLSTIGPSNISQIRDLTLVFEDGESAFLDDDSLRECLKLLAQHGRLENLKLGIHGRRMLKNSEYRFLDNLQAVKADKVEMISFPSTTRRTYGSYWQRLKRANVQGDLDLKLVEKMQRKEKLWSDAPISSRTRRRTFFPVKETNHFDLKCPGCESPWPTCFDEDSCVYFWGYFGDEFVTADDFLEFFFADDRFFSDCSCC